MVVPDEVPWAEKANPYLQYVFISVTRNFWSLKNGTGLMWQTWHLVLRNVTLGTQSCSLLLVGWAFSSHKS